MKSNLAHEPLQPQGEVVRFPKKERQAMAEKFSQGFVQSSQLYRKEVYPFLSDAARHVYFELESKINGFQKDSDFVSYSQLQGNSDLEGARTMSRMTVAKGIKELADHGVITILATHRKLGNKYQINEVSLLGKQYTKKTSTPSELVHVVDRTSTRSRPQVVHVVDTQKKDLNIFTKETHTGEKAPEIFDQDDSWKPNPNFLKTILLQTKFSNRADEIISVPDFNFHLGNFNAHWENKIDLTENQKTRKFAAWLVQEFEKQISKANRSEKQKASYQPASSKNSQTMKAHDEFFAQHGIGSNFESDFIDVHSSEIKTIGGGNQ